MLSSVVIAKNEQAQLPDCLGSLTFADEIILVDTGSSDATPIIARKLGARVVTASGTDFSSWRNQAVAACRGDWILFVDTDERVSPDLQRQILDSISGPDRVYALPRNNILLGRLMRHGGWGGDYVIRLFPRSSFIAYQGALHEQPQFSGPLFRLSAPLLHYSHRSLSSMVDKTIHYTAYEARLRYEAHHPPLAVWRMIRIMLTEFYYRFIRLGAWRDGSEGIIDGLFQVYNSFIIYARLYELQKSRPL